MRKNQLPFADFVSSLFKDGQPPSPSAVEMTLRLAATAGYQAGANDLLLRRLEVAPFGEEQLVRTTFDPRHIDKVRAVFERMVYLGPAFKPPPLD